MRILVFSDSHGNNMNAFNAVYDHPEADCVIFLGDGTRDFGRLSENFDQKFFILKGNCDFADTEHDNFLLENFNNVNIFACHGHYYHVKDGYEEIKSAARSRNCSIVLFGHTHVAFSEYDNGLYVLNPGSCSGYKASYGIIDITENGILTNIVNF